MTFGGSFGTQITQSLTTDCLLEFYILVFELKLDFEFLVVVSKFYCVAVYCYYLPLLPALLFNFVEPNEFIFVAAAATAITESFADEETLSDFFLLALLMALWCFEAPLELFTAISLNMLVDKFTPFVMVIELLSTVSSQIRSILR